VAGEFGDGVGVDGRRPITMRGFGRIGDASVGSIFAIATGAATPPLVELVELPVSGAPPLVGAPGIAVAAVVAAGVTIAPTRAPAAVTVLPVSGVDGDGAPTVVAVSTGVCIVPAGVVAGVPSTRRIPIPALSGVRDTVGECVGAGATNARLAVLARGAVA